MGKLTDLQVKVTQPGEKPRKLPDGGGLYLLLHPNGSRYWRYDYRFAGKRKTLALGVYPTVKLKAAREEHQEAKRSLSKGVDPSATRRVDKLTRNLAAANSFEAIAKEWQEVHLGDKSDSYRDRTSRLLKNDLYPSLGHRPVRRQRIWHQSILFLRETFLPVASPV